MLTTGFIVLGVGALLYVFAVCVHMYTMKKLMYDADSIPTLFLGPILGMLASISVLVGIVLIIVALVMMFA